MIYEPLLLFLGWLGHHTMVLSEMTAAKGAVISPVWYARHRPYKFVLSIIGAVLGYAMLYETGELSMLTAFGVGYISDSLVDRAGQIARARADAAQ